MSDWTAAARREQGVVRGGLLGDHPARTAQRSGLVIVQPRVYVARTQPVTAEVLAAAVRSSVVSSWALLGRTALWWSLGDPEPEVVEVGVPHRTRFRSLPPVHVRRVAPAVLQGSRNVRGMQVVALEIAVLQACSGAGQPYARALLERLLRERRTTVPRLRGRCRRGVAGSAAVRATIDELVGTSLDDAVRRLVKALEVRGITGLRSEVRFTSEAGAAAYADLLDEASSTVVEVDGYLSHVERRRFLADRRRDRWMQAQHGLLTVRVDAQETVDDLDGLADELVVLLRRRRAQRAPASA